MLQRACAGRLCSIQLLKAGFTSIRSSEWGRKQFLMSMGSGKYSLFVLQRLFAASLAALCWCKPSFTSMVHFTGNLLISKSMSSSPYKVHWEKFWYKTWVSALKNTHSTLKIYSFVLFAGNFFTWRLKVSIKFRKGTPIKNQFQRSHKENIIFDNSFKKVSLCRIFVANTTKTENI